MSNNDKSGTVGRTSDPVSKPHPMSEVVPSSVPLTIPYFEVYRTNELEYVEYESPYLNQSSDSDGGSQEGEDEQSEESEEVRKKKAELWTALSNIVWRYFPKISNKDKWIGKLRDANLSLTSVASVTNDMARKSTINGNQNHMIEEVLQAKEKASGTTRQNYASANKAFKAIAKTGNTKKGKSLITALKSSKIQLGNGKTTNDIALNKIGNIYETISMKYK